MISDIIAGPILRKTTAEELVIWWVSPQICRGEFHCYQQNELLLSLSLQDNNVKHFRCGAHAVVHLLHIKQHQLPTDSVLLYDLIFIQDEQKKNLATIQPKLVYPNFDKPSFVIPTKISNLLHGSCRNPHHFSEDSLLQADNKLSENLADVAARPSLLMFSGDQIYADHVAGPMLYVIHQVIELLGLNQEEFSQGHVKTSQELHQQQPFYYQREAILPLSDMQNAWLQRRKNVIFTSSYAHNHLISFAEMMAMYLLVWSPELWQHVELEGVTVPEGMQELYQKELKTIRDFKAGLYNVQRLLAHMPTYMIFDDHDVTDDWNLTAKWEQSAYGHPFSNRIIGNALMAYWLCQGWGNNPEVFEGDFLQQAMSYENTPKNPQHTEFIDHLYQFQQWHYHVDYSPKLIVLDSRTQRWRSESRLTKPSGLMDWESLCQLQQELLGESAVILVSPAPIFGVKLIEAIQKVATTLGQPLAVDAENWMAHPGAANTLLNIFRHPKTPQHFVILSGDVHYSFVYDVEIRFRQSSPHIWQITSSGIKNQFPMPFIGVLDNINRWLYGVYSPLNLFTKRRRMRVKARETDQANARRLVDQSGIGYVELSNDGSPSLICDLHSNKVTTFEPPKHED